MSGRGAAQVAQEVQAELSWSQIREMAKMKGDLEIAMASALRIKLDRLGEKAWLEECQREMGWSRTTAYRHLDPELMKKNRAAAAAARAKVPTVGTSAPAIPAAPAPAYGPVEAPRQSSRIVPPTQEAEDLEDGKASAPKMLTEADSPLAKLDPPLEPNKPPRATEPDQIIPVEPAKPGPDSKHREWSELTPDEREELRRIERIEALLANLHGAAEQIAEVGSELTAAEPRRVAAVVKILLNVVPAAGVQ
jgi:hypothetical protein